MKTKDWLTLIPMLLYGKLLDAYMELPNECKQNLPRLKKALAERADAVQDPLSATKLFVSRKNQWR